MGRGRQRLGVWWTIYVEYELRKKAERFWMWVAWHMPKVLVKWCYVRVGAHATMGEYGKTVVPEITMMDALKRWED